MAWPVDANITIMAEEEPVIIGFDALANFHGQAALAMLAIVFQGLRHTLDRLSPKAPARRSDISIVTGHPGPGVRDAFEFVTRAVTRNVYVVDRSLTEARVNPFTDISYSFRLTLGSHVVSAALRPSILPPRFFELVSFGPQRSVEQGKEFSSLKREIAERVLRCRPDEIFDLR